jgi:Holliday junction resolvase RusA-like endonuclease|tara:strand:+ start:92 stop:490 length:399 start_codon:yes stop_codon:yes gene_type:complete
MTTVNFVIHGEPASKANSRQIVTIRGRPAVIKSKKARDYVKLFDQQCKVLPELLEGDLAVIITIHYASRRPDLDESVILDCMQGKIYANDRQVKEKHIFWSLDREAPRSHIIVVPQDDRASIEGCLRQERES